jgi:VanZ family protein
VSLGARRPGSPEPTAWPHRARLFWLWAPVLLYMAGIFALSATPDLPSPPGGLNDKHAHALVFGGLTLFLYRAVARGRVEGLTVRNGLLAVALATAYGVTDEVHQAFVPGRMASPGDVLADAVGALLAAAGLWACGILWRFWRRPDGHQAPARR